MTVSVIIPSYNHAKYLRERIDSVLDQTFRDFEVIILDDCSTDNSRSIICEYKDKHPDIVAIFSDSNSGSPFAQWNLGVNKSKGEFIWIAESDDSADPRFLEKTVAVMRQNPNAGLVFCDSRIINKEVEYFASERPAIKNNVLDEVFEGKKKFSLRCFLENPITNVSSVLFRKSTYMKVGEADPCMKYCGDWMLYLKVFLISGIEYMPQPLSIFRLHSGSSYHNRYRDSVFVKERLNIYSHIMKKSAFSPLMICLAIKKVLKVLLLYLIHLLRLEKILLPELPRVPLMVRQKTIKDKSDHPVRENKLVS